MKHAGPVALDALESLLEGIRRHAGLRERRRGIFYRGAVAFLHFHEDPAGLFADLKEAGRFVRYPVSSKAERARLVGAVARALRGP